MNAMQKNTETKALIAAINELVAQLKKPKTALQDELWDRRTIAEYLHVAQPTLEKSILPRPDFPVPFQPVQAIQGKKLWFAKDIIQWVKSNKGRLPKGRQPSRAATSEAVAL